jgi:hypothetical protein
VPAYGLPPSTARRDALLTASLDPLLTKAQRAQFLDNGRRQAAAVKGTPAEINLFPVVKLFDPCGAATWLLTEIDPADETSPGVSATSAWAFRNSGPSV